MTTPLLAVDRLCVRLPSGAAVVEDVSFRLDPGEVLALVGESGAGKTTTALALLGAAPPGASITAGRVVVAGQSLLDRPERDFRRLRGRLVAYVPQEPGSALNPARPVGRQIAEIVTVHAPQRDPGPAVALALGRAGLPSDPAFQARYPHQLSGGQQQRVAVAQAIVLEPPLLVLDEPTTGLDVLTQEALLDEIKGLRRQTGVGIVYVTHDLAAIAPLADRIAVMYAGRIVEEGPVGALLACPAHPYTAALIASVPDPVAPRPLAGIPGRASEVGRRPPGCDRRRTREQLRRVQLVFQNPSESLNPRQRVGAAIARPARLLRDMNRPAANDEVGRLLELVRLPATMATRYPGELSGGEQQRVALARALAAGPELLICDEITSALDVSVQAAILDLLGDLQARLGLAMLFISHDLGVVATIADRVIVLRAGTIQEAGTAREVLNFPCTAYAQRLAASAPRLVDGRTDRSSAGR